MKNLLFAGAVSVGLMLAMATEANAGHTRHHGYESYSDQYPSATPRQLQNLRGYENGGYYEWTRMPSHSAAAYGGNSSRARAAATSGPPFICVRAISDPMAKGFPAGPPCTASWRGDVRSALKTDEEFHVVDDPEQPKSLRSFSW